MKVLAMILGAGLTLAFLAPAAAAQELRLELAQKRQEVVRPALDPQAVARQAEQAVQEYQEQVARERLVREQVLPRDRRPHLDPVITQQIQALQVQRALRGFRR